MKITLKFKKNVGTSEECFLISTHRHTFQFILYLYSVILLFVVPSVVHTGRSCFTSFLIGFSASVCFFLHLGPILNFLPITDFFNFTSCSNFLKKNNNKQNTILFFECFIWFFSSLCHSFHPLLAYLQPFHKFRSFGTQQPIALLKLLFEKGGMFDCDRDLKWKIFKDVCYFCAMTTPGGDRNELDARFVSLCATLNINRPTDAIAFNIYRSILRGHLADFSPILHPISDTLIKITLRLFRVRLFFFFSSSLYCMFAPYKCVACLFPIEFFFIIHYAKRRN